MNPAAQAVIAAHLALMVVHAAAHLGLGVMATPAENAFILPVIYLAPIAAWIYLRRGRERAGLWLLAASMLGSFAFATHHHFLVVSIDHVSHLPAGGWRLPFQITAVLAVPVDAAGAVIAVRGLVAAPRRA